MVEKLKTYATATLALLASILFILLRRQVHKTRNVELDVARKEAEHATADARKGAAAASKEAADAQEEYRRLRDSRPDIFPTSES